MAVKETINGIKCTKEELKLMLYLLLDSTLPDIHCKLIEERGNYLCGRCDDCTFKQLLERVRSGELPKKLSQK